MVRTQKSPRTSTLKVSSGLKAKLQVVEGRVDLSTDENRAVRRILDSLGEKRGDLLDAVLDTKGAASRAVIARWLGYQPKPPSAVPRLYPHDIDQLDQLVVDGLLHTQRRVSAGEKGGRGREVVYIVASAVRQVDDEIKREIECQRQASERARQAAIEYEKRQAEAAEEKTKAERTALHLAKEQDVYERWLTEHPQRVPVPRPRRWLGMTIQQVVMLSVMALGTLALFGVAVVLL